MTRGAGIERIDARDGEPNDVIACGGGFDLVRVDPGDTVATSCEGTF